MVNLSPVHNHNEAALCALQTEHTGPLWEHINWGFALQMSFDFTTFEKSLKPQGAGNKKEQNVKQASIPSGSERRPELAVWEDAAE